MPRFSYQLDVRDPPAKVHVTEGTALPGADIWERVTYEWTDSVAAG